MKLKTGVRWRQQELIKARNPNCHECKLYQSAKNICLFGRGPVTGRIMIVGEAPGQNESNTGVVFSGKSGQWINLLLQELHISHDTYITNAVRCRPPENRAPTDEEIETCQHYLSKEIQIVQPSVILVMGKTARASLFGYEEEVEKQYFFGKTFFCNHLWNVNFYCRITYHPAYCLRVGEPKISEFRETLKWAKQWSI